MARKRDVVKKIDQKTKVTGAPLPLIQEDQPVPPAFYLIPAPDTLVLLGQAILRSTQAPLVSVAIGWQEAPNIAPDYYNVEWDESSSFTNVQRARASTTSATISGLKANGVTYYFRVQAVLGGIYSPFSETLSVVTMNDTTPPPDVTGAAAAFQNSDLVITYTIPTSEVLKDVEIKIYNSGHTILYATLYTTSNRFVWTAEQNIYATGGTPLTSVSVDIHTRSWTNTLSSPGVNVTATAAAPSAPAGYATNWTTDDGQADEDFVATWNAASNASSYDITVDALTFSTTDLNFIYRYDKNVTDHLPTLASGDASFTWTLKSRDKLGQTSTPVSVAVSNIAPNASWITLNASAGFSQIFARATWQSDKIVQDFDHWEWILNDGVSNVTQFNSTTPDVIVPVPSGGTFALSVKGVDKFNQKSSAVTQSALVVDALTVAQLRAETQYLDSLGATSPTLDFYKDDVGVGGTSKTYTSIASGTYRWIEAQRPLLDRYKTVTVVGSGTITLSYLSFSDGTTTTYYAGPVTTSTVGTKTLTKYTVEATAKTNAFRLDLLGVTRLDLPNLQEARTVRIYFSNYTASRAFYEYYPRRLVQSDDIEAESIRAINIAASSITADRMSVQQLSAITANIGKLTLTDNLGGTSAWLYQGTGTGDAPTTGIKIWNSAGIGKISGYNGGTEQITIDTDGKLKWGAGTGVADATGIYIIPTSSMADLRSYGFKGTNFLGGMYATEDTSVDALKIWKRSNTGKHQQMYIEVNSPTSKTSSFTMFMTSGLTSFTPFYAEVTSTPSISTMIDAAGTNGLITLLSPVSTSYSLTVGTNLYIANSSRYFYDDGTYTRFTTGAAAGTGLVGLVSHQDLFVYAMYNATGGSGWMTEVINQPVKTTSNVTFNIGAYNGYVQVNGSSPALYVNNNSGTNRRAYLRFQYSGNVGWEISPDYGGTNTNDLYFFDSAAAQLRFQIGPAGNINIQQKLYIGGTGVTPSYQIHLQADSAGKPTTTTWQTTSTKDAKENIKTRGNALDRIKKLRLAEFEYNGKYHTEAGAKGVGFIAEEAKQVYPNTVKEVSYTDDNGVEQTYLAMNPHEIFMDYAAAIQEQATLIETLQAKVAALEAKK